MRKRAIYKEMMNLLLLGVLVTTSSALSPASSKKSASPSKKKAGGFGATKKSKVSAAVLLERSEKRYDELEKKFQGVDDDLYFRDFIIALRCPDRASLLGNQLIDWVPLANLGVATRLPSDQAIPRAVFRLKKEILEAARGSLTGAKQLTAANLEFSYEPLPDFEKRVLDSVEKTSSERDQDVQAARTLLECDETVDDLKVAYRKACRKAHPDSSTQAEDDAAATIGELKAAYDLLSSRKQLSTYEAIGGLKQTAFKGPFLPDSASTKGEEDDIMAAVVRLDNDLVSPFLYRNVKRASLLPADAGTLSSSSSSSSR